MSAPLRTNIFKIMMGMAIFFAIPRMHLLFRGPEIFLRPQYLIQYSITILFAVVYLGLTYAFKLRRLSLKLFLGLFLSIIYWFSIVQIESARGDNNADLLLVLIAPIFVPIWLLLIILGHYRKKNVAFILLFLILVGGFLLHRLNLLGY